MFSKQMNVIGSVEHNTSPGQRTQGPMYMGIKMSFQISEEMMGHTTNGVQAITYHVGKK